jgi:hypothetical protein
MLAAMPLVTQVLKLLALSLAVLFLLGVVATAVPIFFGGSKVKTLFGESQDALAGETTERAAAADAGEADARPATAEADPERLRLFMHASKAGPMPPAQAPQAMRPPVDAGQPAEKPDAGHERVFFPASKSFGGMPFPENPAKQVDP